MKLLACDLDGTLVETEKNFIRKDNIEAIKKLRKEGHKFIVSTGRDIKGIKSIFKDNKEIEFDYLVLCNGALILDNNFNFLSFSIKLLFKFLSISLFSSIFPFSKTYRT